MFVCRASSDGLLTNSTNSSSSGTTNTTCMSLHGAATSLSFEQTSTSTPSSGQPQPEQLHIDSSSSTATDKFHKTKSTTVKIHSMKRLTNNNFLQQTLSLNNRAIQLKREKLRLEKRKVAALEAIACELTTIRSVLCITSNVNIVNTADHESVAKEPEM